MLVTAFKLALFVNEINHALQTVRRAVLSAGALPPEVEVRLAVAARLRAVLGLDVHHAVLAVRGAETAVPRPQEIEAGVGLPALRELARLLLQVHHALQLVLNAEPASSFAWHIETRNFWASRLFTSEPFDITHPFKFMLGAILWVSASRVVEGSQQVAALFVLAVRSLVQHIYHGWYLVRAAVNALPLVWEVESRCFDTAFKLAGVPLDQHHTLQFVGLAFDSFSIFLVVETGALWTVGLITVNGDPCFAFTTGAAVPTKLFGLPS